MKKVKKEYGTVSLTYQLGDWEVVESRGVVWDRIQRSNQHQLTYSSTTANYDFELICDGPKAAVERLRSLDNFLTFPALLSSSRRLPTYWPIPKAKRMQIRSIVCQKLRLRANEMNYCCECHDKDLARFPFWRWSMFAISSEPFVMSGLKTTISKRRPTDFVFCAFCRNVINSNNYLHSLYKDREYWDV